MKIAYVDCFSGVSGDMLVGALLDAGASLEALRRELASLPLAGYQLSASKVTRKGFAGTQFAVAVTEPQPERHLSEIINIILASPISNQVKSNSVGVFRRLAEAEAKVHGLSVEQVHFHEVGAVDSIVDIVAVAVCLEQLEVEAVYSSSVPTGAGSIKTDHGLIPAPGPATLLMLAEAGAPTRRGPGQGELSTPTGVALLASLARFEQPEMTVRQVGVGFGTKEFEWPNLLRIWLADKPADPTDLETGAVVEIEANLDDMTPEAIGWAAERLLAQGALDVFLTPIQMKKGRPATRISVIASPNDGLAISRWMIQHTSTLGIRWSTKSRYTAGREATTVDTPWGPVRVKWKLLGDERTASPEYDDVAAIANRTSQSFEKVYDEVLRLALAASARPAGEV